VGGFTDREDESPEEPPVRTTPAATIPHQSAVDKIPNYGSLLFAEKFFSALAI